MRGVLRNGADRGLLFAQPHEIYRAAGRLTTGGICIGLAASVDLVNVLAGPNPSVRHAHSLSSLLITRLKAKWDKREVGLVELVLHPPGDVPCSGHWLLSLPVPDPVYCCGLDASERLARRVIMLAREEGAREL